MAVFGFHLVLTLLAATIFNKFTARYSITDWAVFKGLYYYLLEGSLLPKYDFGIVGNTKRRRKYNEKEKNLLFKEVDNKLVRLPLNSNALEGVPFFNLLIWTVNYSIFAFIIFFISDIFIFFYPENQSTNTSLIWLFCAILFQVFSVLKLAYAKISSIDLYAERNILFSSAAIFFLASMVFSMFSERFLDIRLSEGYSNVVRSLNTYLNSHGFVNIFGDGQHSSLFLYISVSIVLAAIGSSFLFPVFQYSSLYLDALEQCEGRLTKVFLHATFFAPFLLFLSFTKPVIDHVVESGLLSRGQFEFTQIHAIFLWTLIRVLTAKYHLQVFLNRPRMKVVEYKMSHSLKNDECQRKIAYYASYTCAASIQYYMPVLIVFSSALLYKNLGNIRMSSFWTDKEYNTQWDEHPMPLALLLSKEIQKPLWNLLISAALGIHSLLALVSVIGRRSLFDAIQ